MLSNTQTNFHLHQGINKFQHKDWIDIDQFCKTDYFIIGELAWVIAFTFKSVITHVHHLSVSGGKNFFEVGNKFFGKMKKLPTQCQKV